MFTKHVHVVDGSHVSDHSKQNKLSNVAKHRESRGLDEHLTFVWLVHNGSINHESFDSHIGIMNKYSNKEFCRTIHGESSM